MVRFVRFLILLVLVCAATYGVGRLYYKLTGGFTLGNITYELPHDPAYDTTPLDPLRQTELYELLDQPFSYLGKGCQSYVFVSADQKYVIKFFKYQRFRPKPWLDYLTFFPGVTRHRKKKVEEKREKLEGVFTSWKIAYEDLQSETGVFYVHLNKSRDLQKEVTLIDKMGFRHVLNIDDFEFMIQRKADMLCPTFERHLRDNNLAEAKELLDRLLAMIHSEYLRGFADNDHALMQNTGVLEGKPIHIDIGQFVRNRRVQDPTVYNQEIFNKTWKFRKWLEVQSPELAEHLKMRLRELIGPDFETFQPKLNKALVGVISHE